MDRNGMELTEEENIKKRWKKYTEICKKYLNEGDRGLSLMVSVLRLSPPPLVTALGTVGEEKGRWSPIHPTPSQHHHRLQGKD